MPTMEPPFETRAALLARGKRLADSEPNFARFLLAAVKATDSSDLSAYSADFLETLLRQAYTRLGKRDAAHHRVHLLPASRPGEPEIVEVFSADMPFIVDSVLAAIRARGSAIRFMSHPVLHIDPQSHRLLDAPGPGSAAESFLSVHIDPLPDDAARAAMLDEIDAVLGDVAAAVEGWRPMLERLRRLIEAMRGTPPRLPSPVLAETIHLLGWLADHNFTFLGMREYSLVGGGDLARLEPVKGSGLGLLADPDYRFLREGQGLVESTAQHAAFLAEPDPVLVSKANIRSRVHRRTHMDYIGIKLFGADGRPNGELRVLGLFTSAALATAPTEIPMVRRKVAEMLRRSGFDAASHAGKALMNALDTYPREELFQIAEDELFAFSTLISALADRPRVRVLPRVDRFDNFVSVLVYVPRDRYTSEARARIGTYLATRFDGHVSSYVPHFPEGDLVRVHFIIGRSGGPTPRPDRATLEAGVLDLTLTFADRLLAAPRAPSDIADYAEAFSTAYQSRHSPEEALADIAVIRALNDRLDGARTIALRLEPRAEEGGALGLRVFHRSAPIPLSDRVPMLENFGFTVIDERTYTIAPRGGESCYVHDMELRAGDGFALGLDRSGPLIESAILAVWHGEAESDALNQLTLMAGLAWDDVAILRALTRYLRQVGVAYTRSYMANVLAAHPETAAALLTLFHALNDAGFAGHRDRAAATARQSIEAALAGTDSIDEDRMLRRLLNLVEASLRTNAFQRDAEGARRPALAIKFDCARIDDLPEPRPFREIFVYSPRLEGVHLRFGPIARGGLRWSDRPEDFRTEALALVKAQQVKNAIIVPVGAKGAFVPRKLPQSGDRDAIQREGVACYRIFVSSLLDLTDNLEGETVVPPPDIMRRDGDDPYLVVAADKGTASFSDIANTIARERGYWLDDAFASGGSAGYDHKKMGITARGGWESVKRHFREMDRDIQASPFTVAGVGDMSGDVFGNAMLLSDQIRLVAAFDHRDIFIDPDPDPQTSFAERLRLFSLPRSSWQDYNKTLLSKGGGVYSRQMKQLPLYAEARALLELGSGDVSPQQVISAILRSEVDLIWFGGIGTYVRASSETDAEAGDKANDAVRVTGAALRAKVVGEGANLALTQRGRVEFALAGGRVNTDAIDNSAGVNSSDLEVNIKITLGTLVRNGDLTMSQRDEILAGMTSEVATLCLENNYLQTLAISIAQFRGLGELPDHRALVEELEQRGLLNRRVELLPTDAVLDARAAAGQGFTRPELAVLLSYAKLALNDDLLASGVVDDPYLARELFRYFPPSLGKRFAPAVTAHRLRRDVIATVLANAMVNRGGPGYVREMTGMTSADTGEVAVAFALARDAYGLSDLYRQVDTLDGSISGATQLALYAEIEKLLVKQTLWFLRNADFDAGLSELVLRFAEGVTDVLNLLPSILPPGLSRTVGETATRFEAGGAPKVIARRIAELTALAMSSDIALVSERSGAPIGEAAAVFFAVLDHFGLGRVLGAGEAIVLSDRFDRMALDRALANLMRAQRDLCADVLRFGPGTAASRLNAWHASRAVAVDRAAAAVAALTEGEMTVSRLSVAAGLLSDLARSA